MPDIQSLLKEFYDSCYATPFYVKLEGEIFSLRKSHSAWNSTEIFSSKDTVLFGAVLRGWVEGYRMGHRDAELHPRVR